MYLSCLGRGRGGTSRTRALHKNSGRELQGDVVHSAVYLGTQFCVSSLNGLETKSRTRAMHKGYQEFKAFFAATVPFSLKRVVLLSKVYNAGLSALEARVLLKAECDEIEACFCTLARKAAAGAATVRSNDSDELRAWTNAQVFSHWQTTDVFTELWVRRIGIIKRWAMRPHTHAHELAALMAP